MPISAVQRHREEVRTASLFTESQIHNHGRLEKQYPAGTPALIRDGCPTSTKIANAWRRPATTDAIAIGFAGFESGKREEGDISFCVAEEKNVTCTGTLCAQLSWKSVLIHCPAQIGLTQIEVIPSSFAENLDKSLSAFEYVLQTAQEKAMDVYKKEIDNAEKGEPALIIAADTVVVGQYGEILEKPKSEVEHITMLKMLRDTGLHKVYTGVACMAPLESAKMPGYALETHVEETSVKFDPNGKRCHEYETNLMLIPYSHRRTITRLCTYSGRR